MSKFIDAGSSGEWGWHATELAMKCPQAFAYAYRVPWSEAEGDGKPVRPVVPKPALLKGSLIHQGIAHHYARMRDGASEWATVEDAIHDCARKLGPAADEFIDVALAAVRAYAAYYYADSLKPLSIEEVFSAEISGWKFTQRFDLVARDASGRIVVVDHKTTSAFSTTTASRYALSGQFLGMAQFGRALWGAEFGGVLINLIEMRESAGVSSFNFKRVPVDPSPNALRLFPLTIKHARDRVAELDRSGLDPLEWPKVLSETVCTTSYGHCEWRELCRWGAV